MTQLNSELLTKMIRSKRSKKGLREAAKEIGNISAATLSRIEQGKIPDVDTFIKICKWLGVSTDTFIIEKVSKKTQTNHEFIVAHLRAEKELPSDTVSMLIKMIEMAYDSK